MPGDDEGLGGDGLGITTGAQASLEHSALHDNAHVGSYALGPGSRFTAFGALVDSTQPNASNGDHGYGFVATYGAEAMLDSTASVHNRAVGVFGDVDGQIDMRASLIDGTLPQQTGGMLGTGLSLQDQSSADVDDCAITACPTLARAGGSPRALMSMLFLCCGGIQLDPPLPGSIH